MNSGTFHVNSQEWRYFSREKAIVHTTHLAELPFSSSPGNTVLIATTPPVQNQNRGGHNPLQTPPSPYFQTNLLNVLDDSFTIDCYGCVNYNGQILAQKNMGITVGPLEGGMAYVDMTPEESGYFVVHVEANSDFHTFGYQGVANDGKVTVQILQGNLVVAQSISQIFMNGPSWDAVHNYLNSMARAVAETLLPASSFRGLAFNLGAIAQGARFCMWAYKVGDL